MKILRKTIVSSEKNKKPPDWANNKHYHSITFEFDRTENTITFIYNLYYITGHGPEKIDEIYIYGVGYGIYKTQDINNINKNIEIELIKALIEINNKTHKNNSEQIEHLKQNNEKLLNSNNSLSTLLRGDKLKRVLE